MARTYRNGYELLLFLKENRISLQAAKKIIADAEAALIKWKAEKVVITEHEKRQGG